MIELRNIIDRLEKHIIDHNFSGYDPYDYKSMESYRNFISTGRPIKYLIDIVGFFSPICTRKYFNVKPDSLFPSVLGYMLESYCLLYRSTGGQEYLGKAIKISDRLLEMSTNNYPGLSWGLPFSWMSGKKLIPAGTPNVVNTVEIGQGFLELYKILNNDNALKILLQIVFFIQNGLNITYQDDNSLCKSYTPVDDYQVHNANLLAASFIANVGQISNDQNLIEQAKKMGRFSVNDQRENGCLPYQSSIYQKNSRIDPDLYHSAYEIRSLYTIYHITGDKTFADAFEKYLLFFNNYFFKNCYPVTMYYKGISIMDIHGCAEAIYCYSVLSDYDQKYLDKAYTIAKWTQDKFWHKNKYFRYKTIKYGFLKYQSSIPFLRWGQSVMFRALTRLTYTNSKYENK